MASILITINGKEIEAKEGSQLLQASLENGIHIPHYCYHPALSIAGNCRMCLVEIQGIPKLQTSCSTVIRPGMKVFTDSDRVKKARKHVLEFLLVNHPVDCPVCDQAGECGLQDYYMSIGKYDSRFAVDKVTKTKKAFPVGKWIMLDQERCILCSRCVRFTREISGNGELSIYKRGDHCEVDVYPGIQLLGRYTGNLADICPVGALTCRDFRFKCRVWYLEKTPSICPGCSRGCNTEIHTNPSRPHHGRGDRIMRIKPRFSPEINKNWICDDGRYNYKKYEENRLDSCWVKDQKADFKTSTQVAFQLLNMFDKKEVAVLFSPALSNEDIYSIKKLFCDYLDIDGYISGADQRTGDFDNFLITEDKNPNTHGAMNLFGSKESLFVYERETGGLSGMKPVKALILAGCEFSEGVENFLLNSQVCVIYLGTKKLNNPKFASVTIPLTVYYETEGTFTNNMGITQKFYRALPPLGDSRPLWSIVDALSNLTGFEPGLATFSSTHQKMITDYPCFLNQLKGAGK